jgi:acetylornithine/succinyldiaminopimelate/putrescine aminotransferase
MLQKFKRYLAPTSNNPVGLQFVKAEGIYLIDADGKKYIDAISGIAVSNVGHGNKAVADAIKSQVDAHTHLMVYGEYAQSAQINFAELLCSHLPEKLQSVYFTNSGAEAIEGALKLAKRVTARREIISFKNAYHGSTHGALSIMGDEFFKNAYRPLLPDTLQIRYNHIDDLKFITHKTACVVVEPIQAEAGIINPQENYLQLLRARCNETGALLIFDEIQTGMGRTGKLFAHEHYGVTPDVICLAKALGGGMPLGTFVSSIENMQQLADNPPLGHITTFGGHPVCCAAGKAALDFIINENLIEQIAEKEKLFLQLLKHKSIKETRSKGLLIAIEFETEAYCKKIIADCIADGLITDWFLFNANSMRLAPPLTITTDEIKETCNVILNRLR